MTKFIFTGFLLILLLGFFNYPTQREMENIKKVSSRESMIIFPISEQIKLARMDKQITLKELADRLGVKKMDIQKFEKGQLVPTKEILEKLEIHLDTHFQVNGY